MSVTPACTSGTTILCSDETTRNNNISTPYNAHSHTDIAAMSGVNTFTIGDGTSGNKDYCEDSATDRCIRWNESAGLWTVQQGGTTYNQIVVFSGTTGISAGRVLVADGTGALVALTSATPADDAALIGDSATAATWRAVPNCTASTSALQYTTATNSFSCGTISTTVTPAYGNFTRDVSLASGTQAITGVGFQPSMVLLFAALSTAVANNGFSSGIDAGATQGLMRWEGGDTADTAASRTDLAISVFMGPGSGTRYDGDVTTLGADGFTVTWTKVGSPTGTMSVNYIAFR